MIAAGQMVRTFRVSYSYVRPPRIWETVVNPWARGERVHNWYDVPDEEAVKEKLAKLRDIPGFRLERITWIEYEKPLAGRRPLRNEGGGGLRHNFRKRKKIYTVNSNSYGT